MAIGMVSLTFGGADRVAFAVYSADDQSLDFYKRLDVPEVGDTFERKIVTNVYTEFETDMPTTSSPVPWRPVAGSIESIQVVDLGIAPRSMYAWFFRFSNLKKCDLRRLDTSEVESMQSTFAFCQSLASLDLSSFDTSNVETMVTMFASCTSLKSLDISNFDTSKVNQIDAMFQNCESLISLDLSSFNTSSIGSMQNMFNKCYDLQSLDISGFNTSRVKSFCGMFQYCKSLGLLDLSSFDTSSAETMWAMFYQCESLSSLSMPSVDTSNVADMRSTFDGCFNLRQDCTNWDVSSVTQHGRFSYDAPDVILPKPWQAGAFAVYSADDGSLDFYKRVNCELPAAGNTFNGKTITTIYTGFETQRFVDNSSDSGNWTAQKPDTPWWNLRLEISSVKVVDTGIKPSSVDYWFYGMENLKTVDVANLDTSLCYDFKMTFGYCEQIETIDLSAWSTASLGNLQGTFLGCKSLSTLDIDGWNTSKVVSFHCLMFECHTMSSAQMQKVVDNLNVTACANDLGYLFYGCWKLTTLDLTSWNISNVMYYQYMFLSCHDLTLDCSNWNVRQDAWHGDFNLDAPGVIPPKAWQPTAFAVFSADDKSLNFYKQEYKDMPKVGDTFNNKTVSEVYSDIEDYDFKISYETDVTGVGNAPWWNHRADILSVKVVDRIRPKKTCAVGSSILRTLSPLILGRLTRAM